MTFVGAVPCAGFAALFSQYVVELDIQKAGTGERQ